MKFFLAAFACLFMAINADPACCPGLDLSGVNRNLADLKVVVVELVACNDLQCTRDILARADISLRENADCAVNEINALIRKLEEERDVAIANGRSPAACLDDIQRLRDLACSIPEEVNAIVDVLVEDGQQSIGVASSAIEDKEVVCCLQDRALACENQACVDSVVVSIREEVGERRCSIRNLLLNIRADIKRRISCASGRIAALVELRKRQAREIADRASVCLQQCK